ncbi:MAG: GGDEF domain-containing protein, partial [Chitinimonas sp.]|nr:GGDEF domain-containing protein [Chitinimonas sp.]
MDTAGIDPLTGFLDRHGCLRNAARLTEHAHRDQKPLSAIWVNLDRFRKINGSLGMGGGDAVIAKMGDRLRSRNEHRTHIARMGSDEFLLLAPAHGCEEAASLASEL